MKIKLNCCWRESEYELDADYPQQVVVWIDKLPKSPIPDGEKRIVVMWEPLGLSASSVINNQDKYDYVLTYRDEVLRDNPKARFFLGVTVFQREECYSQKGFCVSTVVGHKVNNNMPGYNMRHELWFKKDRINMDTMFYLSGEHRCPSSRIKTAYGDIEVKGELRLGMAKDVVFRCMFHIAIENKFFDNWFTEKIVDCFMGKTVPIYIGAKNIGRFFNEKGIIQVQSVDEAIGACNSLTEDDYYSRAGAINDNFERSQKYLYYDKMLIEKVLEVLP